MSNIMDGLCRKKGLIKLLFINVSVIISLNLFCGIPDSFAFKKAEIIAHPAGKDSVSCKNSNKIMEYRRSLDLINKQISFLKENRSWLNLKIERLKDFNRHVPESMKKSIAIKTSQIKALRKVKKRLTANLKDLMKSSYNADRVSLSSGTQKQNNLFAGNLQSNIAIKQSGNTAGRNDFIKELQNRIKKAGLGDWIEISSDDKCCRLVTSLPILFASGSSRIADTYKNFFKKLAGLIRGYDVRVVVDGYADIDSIHNKKYRSNFELGAARAANVVHELVKYGVKPSVFKIGTTGKYRFKAKGMSRNKVVERRADLTIIFAV